RFAVGGRDLDRAVVGDVNLGSGLLHDLADHLAARADHLADLVDRDRDHFDARRVRAELGAMRGERLAHLAEDVHAAVLGLAERDPHDLLVDAGDLDVHLQRGDAALGPVPTNDRFLHDGRSPDRPALHYVLFALPTFTPRRVTGAISLTL